jgi:hypothetical protein
LILKIKPRDLPRCQTARNTFQKTCKKKKKRFKENPFKKKEKKKRKKRLAGPRLALVREKEILLAAAAT